MLVLTVQKLGVNVPQDICHSQLLSRTGASMNPEPGWFGQSRAQSCDGQSSGQGRHQAPLRLLGQGGAPSSPATSRDSRTRRGIHVHPLSLLSVAPLLTVCDCTKRSVSKVSQLTVQSKKLAGTLQLTLPGRRTDDSGPGALITEVSNVSNRRLTLNLAA